MEKRRRARINESLGQLKTLILDALKKDVSVLTPVSWEEIQKAEHVEVIAWMPFSCAELQTLQTGESRHPGDDSETSPEPPESSNDW